MGQLRFILAPGATRVTGRWPLVSCWLHAYNAACTSVSFFTSVELVRRKTKLVTRRRGPPVTVGAIFQLYTTKNALIECVTGVSFMVGGSNPTGCEFFSTPDMDWAHVGGTAVMYFIFILDS